MILVGHLWTLTNQCSALHSVEIDLYIHFEMTKKKPTGSAELICSAARCTGGSTRAFPDIPMRGKIGLTEDRIENPINHV